MDYPALKSNAQTFNKRKVKTTGIQGKTQTKNPYFTYTYIGHNKKIHDIILKLRKFLQVRFTLRLTLVMTESSK